MLAAGAVRCECVCAFVVGGWVVRVVRIYTRARAQVRVLKSWSKTTSLYQRSDRIGCVRVVVACVLRHKFADAV